MVTERFIRGLVGALRRGYLRNRRRFVAAFASFEKRADGDSEREREEGTVAEERQRAEAFAGAKASAINFEAGHVGADHHGEEGAEEQRGYQGCITEQAAAEQPQAEEQFKRRQKMRSRADQLRRQQLVGIHLHGEE